MTEWKIILFEISQKTYLSPKRIFKENYDYMLFRFSHGTKVGNIAYNSK